MMMGLYLILPLLRLWVNKENIRYVRYFLILAVIFGFFLPQAATVLSSIHPVFTRLNALLDSWQIHYPVGFTAYFVLGWYLGQVECSKKKAILALAIGVIVTFAGTFLIRRFTAQTAFIFYEDLSLNVLLSAIGLFLLFTRVYARKDYPQGNFGRLVGLVGRHSLGIYATHVAVMTVADYILPDIHPAVNIPVLYIVSVAGALVASVVLSKLPLLKKVV
jgi:surface polysaccharide O-acyltransferase-like enzyme